MMTTISDEPSVWTNYFVHCRTEWTDEWSHTSNDACPICGREIEPYASHDEDGSVILHVRANFTPEDGWPDGCADPTDLNGWPDSAPVVTTPDDNN